MSETFEQLVDRVAGHALQRLIRGENWRSIIFGVADQVAMWCDKREKTEA